jgi:glutathione S-transferase
MRIASARERSQLRVMLEIHGLRECPFAWRARVAAREKGVPFVWIAYDAEPRDPRADSHNQDRKSPKLYDGGFELIESLAIMQFIDEACDGPPLAPADPRERALMRARFSLAHKLEMHPPEEAKIRKAYAALEAALRGKEWLGGQKPDLSDMAIWPFLYKHAQAGFEFDHPYWRRSRERASLLATRP